MTVRCVLEDCTWSFEGPADEAKTAAAEHRAHNHEDVAAWVRGVVEDRPFSPNGDGHHEDAVHALAEFGVPVEDIAEVLDVQPEQVAEIAPSGRSNSERSRRGWTKDELIACLQAYAAEHDGVPPGFMDWKYGEPGRPTSQTFRKAFGSWNAAIEAAGLRPRLIGETIAKPRGVDVRTKNGWAVKVPGTGLAYRSPEEAYVAAEEVEQDGQRVADDARFDGNEAKAEQAIDRARDLAEQIRIAARAIERKGAPPTVRNSVPGTPGPEHEVRGEDMRTAYIAMLLRKADETTDPALLDRLERLLGFGEDAA